MSEIPSSSLDARELLSRPIDQFHAKSYEIGGDFRILWGTIDMYLRRLDPIVKDIQEDIIPLERHSPLYRETRQRLYLEISRMPGFDIAKIQSIDISPSGILSVRYTGKTESINLTERWNMILLPSWAKEQVQKKAEKARTELEKEVATESLYDGSVLISYIPATALTLLTAHALYDGGKKSINTAKYILDKVTVRDTDGKMRIISLWEAYTGTKESIKWSIMKLLEKAGYLWDAVRKWWFSPVERSLEATKKQITAQNYEEYKKTNPNTKVSEQEYQKLQQEVIGQIEKSSWVTLSERVSNI